MAKERKYLLLRGTGWRKERGDSPLANIYRMYCDAHGIPCISVERGVGIDALDSIIVDVSPLRTKDVVYIKDACSTLLMSYNCTSFISLDDYSDIDSFGWEKSVVSDVLLKEPVWKIPGNI